MCWTLVPVLTRLLASLSSHFLPDATQWIEAARPPVRSGHEHAVVSHVAEQRRVEIHPRHAGERVLRELRELEHRDLAVLLLHLLGVRQIGARRGRSVRDRERLHRVRVLVERGLIGGATATTTSATRTGAGPGNRWLPGPRRVPRLRGSRCYRRAPLPHVRRVPRHRLDSAES